MQPMATNQGTKRCILKKYAKEVLFLDDFAAFWAQTYVVEASK